MSGQMTKVPRLGFFTKNCKVVQFLGKTIDLALVDARESKLDIVYYFEQPEIGKSKFRAILCEIKGE